MGMTKEEAKEIFLNRGFIDGIYDGDKWREAYIVISKWLEQESTTKNDLGVEECISRKAALDACHNFAIGVLDDYYEKCLKQWIIDLPSVTPQEPRWIPCSEKLPENKETVLVTFKHFVSGNTIGLGSMILLRDKPHWHVREQNLGTYDVLAWMPLPKGYGEVEE